MTRKEVIENLKKARDLIKQPGRWCRHALFRKRSGPIAFGWAYNESGPAEDAQFCALGACAAVTNMRFNALSWSCVYENLPEMTAMLDRASVKHGFGQIFVLNDASSSAECVAQVFDEAIELAAAEGGEDCDAEVLAEEQKSG